jgi:outer membrane protein OmpA-like peptidoglycan-associated protein
MRSRPPRAAAVPAAAPHRRWWLWLPLLGAGALLPFAAAGQESATGTVTIDRPPPEPRGVVIERPGAPPVEVPRGQALDVRGADVVVVEETPRGTQLTVQNDVLFDFDRVELRPQAAEALTRVADILRERRPRAARIVGHTDSVGSDGYNQALSERRARAVERWLAANGGGGLPPMQVEGQGEGRPVAPNTVDGRDNPEGRQKNRRVEVLLER